ncbi:MAG: ATP-binding protein [Planctomycetes bacterium]|nr:ATP-binding protein [Planctomycetota bacterium]MCB9904770.1 ATP-binding protein [Planctomycetota bacterium]
MAAPHRIYLVGAHSTGKTTLARWIRDRYGLPMISEVARGVLAEMEEQLDSLRTDVDLVDRYQAEVFRRQITAEEQQLGAFVSDRAFCNLAYAAQHATILHQVAADPKLSAYIDSVRSGLVFYLRPHRDLLCEDGVRAGVEWEEVVRIDGMVKFMLEWFGISYIPVDALSMQERMRLTERVLDLAGLPRKLAATPASAEPAPAAPLERDPFAADALEREPQVEIPGPPARLKRDALKPVR